MGATSKETGWRLGAGLVPVGDAALAQSGGGRRGPDRTRRPRGRTWSGGPPSVTAGSDIVVVAHAHSGRLLTDTVRLGQSIPSCRRSGSPISPTPARTPSTPGSPGDGPTLEGGAAHAPCRCPRCRYPATCRADAEARRRFEADIAKLARRPASRAARRSRTICGPARTESAAFGLHNGSGGDQRQARSSGRIGLHAMHQIEPERIAELGASVAAAAAFDPHAIQPADVHRTRTKRRAEARRSGRSRGDGPTGRAREPMTR